MLAQNLDEIQSNGLPGFNFAGSTVGELVSDILKTYVFYIAGIILLIYLVMGGLQMMLSRGDPKAMQAAQGKVTNALIGFVIVIFSYVIVRLIGQVLNIEVFNEVFK